MDKIVQKTETLVDKIIDFFDDPANNGPLSAIDDIKNPVVELKALKQDYTAAAKIQLAPHTTRKAVDKAKKAFADKLQIKLDIVHATVKKSGDDKLLTLVETPTSYILSATKGEASIKASLILDALESNLGVLLKNKLKKEDIDDLRALLTTYDNLKDLPLQARDKKKVKGTNVLAALNKKAREIIKDLKISVRGYLAENTLLRDSFLAAATAPKAAKKSNVAKISLLDENGNPFAENVRAYDIKSKAKKTPSFKANSNGVILINGHKVGKFPFKLVIKGKADVIITIEFKKGETVEVTVTIK